MNTSLLFEWISNPHLQSQLLPDMAPHSRPDPCQGYTIPQYTTKSFNHGCDNQIPGSLVAQFPLPKNMQCIFGIVSLGHHHPETDPILESGLDWVGLTHGFLPISLVAYTKKR